MGIIPPLNSASQNQTPVSQAELTDPLTKTQEETNKQAVQVFNDPSSLSQPNILKRTWVKISNSTQVVIQKIQKTFHTIYFSLRSIFTPYSNNYALKLKEEVQRPSLFKEIFESLDLERALLESALEQKINFDDPKGLTQLSQIYFEVEENQALLRERLEEYQSLNQKDLCHNINLLQDRFSELKEKINTHVKDNQGKLKGLLTNPPLVDKEDPLLEWKQKSYQRCLAIYTDICSDDFLLHSTEIEQPAEFSFTSFFKQLFSLPSSLPIDPNAPIGMDNGGNNCYAISSMQALLAQPFFLEKIKNITPVAYPLKKADETEEAFKIRLEDHAKLEKIQTALKDFYTIFSGKQVNSRLLHQAIVDLRNTIFDSKIHGSLQPNEILYQQDAADFYAVVLQALNYALVIETKRQDLSLAIESTQKSDNQLFLLSKPKNKAVTSIEELIQESILEQTIDDTNNIWKPTDKDGKVLEFSSYNHLMHIANPEPPQVICFQIKRFEYDPITGNHSKMQDRFSFESEILDLSSIFSPISQEPIRYRLSSCINHLGSTLRGGHYTSYVRKEEQWYHCNDSNVNAVSAAEVEKEEAYILVLEKINEPSRNTSAIG